MNLDPSATSWAGAHPAWIPQGGGPAGSPRRLHLLGVAGITDPESPMSACRPNSRAQCDRSAERQVYPGVRSCAGAATPRLKLSSPSVCGSSTQGIRLPWRPPCSFFGALPHTRRSHIHPQIHPAGLGSAPRLWIRFPHSQLFCCVALPAHPAARDKGPRSAIPRRALQSESSPEPAGGWKKCELPAVRDDKGPGECAAPPPEPGLLQRPRPRPAAAWAKGRTCPSGEPPALTHAPLCSEFTLGVYFIFI